MLVIEIEVEHILVEEIHFTKWPKHEQEGDKWLLRRGKCGFEGQILGKSFILLLLSNPNRFLHPLKLLMFSLQHWDLPVC